MIIMKIMSVTIIYIQIIFLTLILIVYIIHNIYLPRKLIKFRIFLLCTLTVVFNCCLTVV